MCLTELNIIIFLVAKSINKLNQYHCWRERPLPMSTLLDLWVAVSTASPRAPLESFSDQPLGAKDQPTGHTTLKQEQSNRLYCNKFKICEISHMSLVDPYGCDEADLQTCRYLAWRVESGLQGFFHTAKWVFTEQ